MLNSNISSCPNCKLNDSVQYVSAIVEAGTSHTSGYYYGNIDAGPIYNTQQTALAQRLSPQPEPTYARTFGSGCASTVFTFLLIALPILSLSYGFPAALSICGAIAAVIWILVAKYERKMYQRVCAAHDQWKRYMDDYRTWLYCHRCNTSFRPTAHNDSNYQDEINRMAQMDNNTSNENTPSAWASELLQRDDFCILDLETTDLNGYIVDVAVIDKYGNTLFNSLVNPQVPISPGAQRTHGITDADVALEPPLPLIWTQLLDVLNKHKTIITYW